MRSEPHARASPSAPSASPQPRRSMEGDVQDRPRVWLFGALLSLPLVGLALLLAVPSIDVMWEHHPSHFLLVLAVALINVALALRRERGRASTRGRASVPRVTRADHELGVPRAARARDAGRAARPPELRVRHRDADRPAPGLRVRRRVRGRAQPRRCGEDPRVAERGSAAPSRCCWSPGRSGRSRACRSSIGPSKRRPRWRSGCSRRSGSRSTRSRRGATCGSSERGNGSLPLSVAVAFLLLAEALIAVAFARSWHASWWEWHVLMAIAFAIVTISVRTEFRREGSVTAAFGGLYLEQTLERIDRRSSAAIAQLMPSVRTRESLEPALERLRRDGFGSEEVALLERAAREMARVDDLFRPYVGPALADRLELEPSIAELGGREAEVSVLFADLAGFTGFSDGRSPMDVVQMLNAYWATAVPIVTEREGGLIERFAGDAILVVFNALEDQPDHALRAVRAARAMQLAVGETSGDHPDWPRFRIGVNSGPAALGNVGAGAHRSFTAIGDTTNVAARLQAAAPPGGILIGQATYEAVRDEVTAEPFGDLDLKGKPAPVPTFEVRVDPTTSA